MLALHHQALIAAVALFLLLALVPSATGTTQHAYLAEAESSIVCYTRYEEGAAVWNALMTYLPTRHMVDATLIGRDISMLRALLVAGVSPCEAVGRVLRIGPYLTAEDKAARKQFLERCGTAELLPAPLGTTAFVGHSPLMTCLNGARFVGVVASLLTPLDVATHALNLRIASSSEEAIVYDGTYATNYTRAVVTAALAG
jgi:hypothetical protein